ncbi:hypothetical protein C0989_010326 [Termitomyces sp. Mn162]|nr:hypothetical protein C0989_010326 [Termitomyces sp. Mn162]
MRVVWKEMRSLLGTKKDREFPNIVSERPELLAAPRDVFNFCFDDDAPGPNLQHPQIYIEAPENIWNVSLARQFADMVMQKYPEKDLSTDIVARHFLNRLDTLWKACAKACPRANEQPEDVLVRMTAEFQAMSHRNEREETTHLYSDIPAKLPTNFYDKVWFETLVPGLQTKLDPHPVLNLPHLQN